LSDIESVTDSESEEEIKEEKPKPKTKKEPILKPKRERSAPVENKKEEKST